jgi:hypothetical protein
MNSGVSGLSAPRPQERLMQRISHGWILGVGAIALTAGCAQTPNRQSIAAPAIEPLYRFSEPAGTASGQYAVGRIDLAEGRVDAAILRFRAALRLDAKFVDANNALGVAYGQQGRFAEAIEQFEAALKLDPNAAHVLNNLGFAQLKAGQVSKAKTALERALALHPENAGVRANLAAADAALKVVELAAVPQAAVAPMEPGRPGVQPASETLAEDVATSPAGSLTPRVEFLSGPVFAQFDLDLTKIAFADTGQSIPTPAASFTRAATGVEFTDSRYRIITATESSGSMVQVAANVFEWRDREPVVAQADVPVALPATVADSAQASSSATTTATTTATTSATASATRSATRSATASTTSNPLSPEALIAAIKQFLPEKMGKVLAQKVSVDYGGIEVVNNLGVRGLGDRWSEQLRQKGLDVVRVTEQQSPVQARTTIYYRSGFSADARHLADRLRTIAPRIELTSSLPAGVDIRLVLGKDAGRPVVVDASQPEADSQAKARILIDGFVV